MMEVSKIYNTFIQNIMKNLAKKCLYLKGSFSSSLYLALHNIHKNFKSQLADRIKYIIEGAIKY